MLHRIYQRLSEHFESAEDSDSFFLFMFAPLQIIWAVTLLALSFVFLIIHLLEPSFTISHSVFLAVLVWTVVSALIVQVDSLYRYLIDFVTDGEVIDFNSIGSFLFGDHYVQDYKVIALIHVITILATPAWILLMLTLLPFAAYIVMATVGLIVGLVWGGLLLARKAWRIRRQLNAHIQDKNAHNSTKE